jgi:hypothetical protein
MELDRAHAAPDRSPTSVRDEHNFEAIFQIPPTHRLVLVRSRSHGSPVSATFWEHDEYDTLGRLAARYRSFEQVNALGEAQRGWLRFDCQGHMMSEEDNLQ